MLQVNVLLTAIQLFGWFAESKASVKWWDIVPPELEDESDEYSNSINNCSPTYRDEIDKSGLLEELKDLNENVERAGSNIGNHDSDPLFANSNICVKEFVILLLGIVTRHRLTSVALEDILDFINISSPVENSVQKDVVEVYAFFEKHAQRIVKHFFCPNKKCQAYISNTSLQGKEKCNVCNMKLAEEAVFLEIPVQDQLKAVLSGTVNDLIQCLALYRYVSLVMLSHLRVPKNVAVKTRLIGHFRIPKTLTFKLRQSAQPFL